MELYKRSGNIISGEVDDCEVMINIDKGKYFGLNPVARRIWLIIEQPSTIEDITKILLEEYEVDEIKCKEEVAKFLNDGVKNGIISIA